MATKGDPFSTVHAAIWSALTTSTEFTSLVLPGNQIKLNLPIPSGLMKDNPQTADTPEIIVMQGRFTMRPFVQNALAVGLSQNFPIVGTARDFDVTNTNYLKWVTLKALVQYDPTGLLLLPNLVTRFTISECQDDPGVSQWARGTKRWVSLLQISVDMSVDKSAILM